MLKVQSYIVRTGGSLLVEIWQDNSDDGDVYEIKPNNLAHAINLTNKYYDNVCAKHKVAELILREPNGEFTCIYHVEKNRSGLTYEVLKY